MNPIYLMGSVHPDKAVRDAADPCLTKYTTLSTDLFQSEKLFARVKAANAANRAPGEAAGRTSSRASRTPGVALRAGQAQARQGDLRPPRGAAPGLRQERARRPHQGRHGARRDGGHARGVRVGAEEERGGQLRARASTTRPTYRSSPTRRARRRASATGSPSSARAVSDNLARLDEIFLLRKELAALYDLPSFAAYSLRRKMVEKPETVMKFLGDVKSAVTELEKKELEELRAEKAKDTGTALSDTALQSLGRLLLPGKPAQGALFHRPGAAAQVLPDRQGHRLHAGAFARRSTG